MPIETGTRTRLPESPLAPEHALVVALLRQLLQDRRDRTPRIRQEAQAFFASGQHHFWLLLVGLDPEAFDRQVHEEDAA